MATERKWKKANINSDVIAAEQQKTAATMKLIDSYKAAIPAMRQTLENIFTDVTDTLGTKNLTEASLKIDEIKEVSPQYVWDELDKTYVYTRHSSYGQTFIKLNNGHSVSALQIPKFLQAIIDATKQERFVYNKEFQMNHYSNEFYNPHRDYPLQTLDSILPVSSIRTLLEGCDQKYKTLESINSFHDQYEALLELDKRQTDEQDTKAYEATAAKGVFGSLFGVFGDFNWLNMGGSSKPEAKATDSKAEAPSFWSSLFAASDTKDAKAAQENTDASKQVSTNLVSVDSDTLTNKVHQTFQSYVAGMLDTAKAACYSNVITMQKEAAGCMIRRPNVEVDKMSTSSCDEVNQKAKIALGNCDYIFPMATANDQLISEFMIKVVTVKASVNDASIGFKTYNDQSLFNTVYNSYVDTPQQMLTSALDAPATLQIAGTEATPPLQIEL